MFLYSSIVKQLYFNSNHCYGLVRSSCLTSTRPWSKIKKPFVVVSLHTLSNQDRELSARGTQRADPPVLVPTPAIDERDSFFHSGLSVSTKQRLVMGHGSCFHCETTAIIDENLSAWLRTEMFLDEVMFFFVFFLNMSADCSSLWLCPGS